MLKRAKMFGLAAMVIGMTFAPALAADYASMSTEELAALRGTMQGASQEERTAFRQEWRKRFQQMTPEERQQYAGRPSNAPGDGSGMHNRRGNRRGLWNQQGYQDNNSWNNYRGKGMGMGGMGGRGGRGGRR